MPRSKTTFIKGISFSYLYIVIYLITGILTTPLLLNHFGAEYFALLMLIYAIITYLNNIRFGLPESMAALLAQSKDKLYNIFLVKKIFILLLLITLVVLGLFLAVSIFIDDWRILLGDLDTLDKERVVNIFYIFIIFALIKVPLDISLYTFVGFHEVYLEKIYKIINPLVNFTLVIFVVHTNQNILFFAFWAGLLDFMVSLISFIHVISRYKIFANKNILNTITSKKLLKNGMLFFQLSLTQSIIWGVGIFFVSHILSLTHVTIYSLTMKVYIYIFYTFIIINSVIAPLYGKYFSNNNWIAIREIFNILLLILPFIGGGIWITTLFFMSDIIILWTGSNEFYIGHSFVFFLGIFFYFTGYINSYITLLYSIGKIKLILLIRWKEVFVNLLITLIATYLFGLVGVAMGMAFAITVISVRYIPKCILSFTNNEIKINFKTQKKHFYLILAPSIFITVIIILSTNIFVIKFLCFICISMLYIWTSWRILESKDKDYILALLKHKGKSHE